MAQERKFFGRNSLAIGGLVLGAILFIAVNVYSNATFRSARVDLTENKLFTLSDGTREILGSIKEPIRFRLFISRDLVRDIPAFARYAKRVLELLEEYVSLSNGMLRLEIINPEPFSREEDRAVGLDLQGVPLNQTGELVYFGLAGTNTTDDRDVIPFFSQSRERFLEYDLTRLVLNLANPEKKVVGLMSDLRMEGEQATRFRPWRLIELMRQSFEVKNISFEPEKELNDDIDVLLVAHPQTLTDKALYAIDQFVVGGGKAIFFVDPYSEEAAAAMARRRMPPTDEGSNLPKLFDAWGIEFVQDRFVGDRGSAQRVSAGNDPGGRPIVTDYLAWLSITGDRLNRSDVITGELETVAMASVGSFKAREGASTKLEPLIVSTKEAMLYDVVEVRGQPKLLEILRAFKSADKSYTIAARVTGLVKSAYPDGPPPDKEKKDEKPDAAAEKDFAKLKSEHLAQSKQPVNLIVVGDTDILADRMWYRVQDFFGQRLGLPIASNANFVINALDNLAGSSALITLRSRGISDRPFKYVQAIQKDAELRYRSREQVLTKKLKDVEEKLKNLQTREQGGGSAILNAEQKSAIANFRKEMVETRIQLREVQLALRRDIDAVETWLKFLNIAAIPILIGLFAIALAIVRWARKKHRHAHAAA